MKTFSQYLTESEKTFDYRIKICGDVNAELLKMFRENSKSLILSRFQMPRPHLYRPDLQIFQAKQINE